MLVSAAASSAGEVKRALGYGCKHLWTISVSACGTYAGRDKGTRIVG
jgi:hypothetical protein